MCQHRPVSGPPLCSEPPWSTPWARPHPRPCWSCLHLLTGRGSPTALDLESSVWALLTQMCSCWSWAPWTSGRNLMERRRPRHAVLHAWSALRQLSGGTGCGPGVRLWVWGALPVAPGAGPGQVWVSFSRCCRFPRTPEPGLAGPAQGSRASCAVGRAGRDGFKLHISAGHWCGTS